MSRKLHSHRVSRSLSLLACALAFACASGPQPPADIGIQTDGRYRTSVVVDSVPRPATSGTDTSFLGLMPGLTVAELSEGGMPERRIQLLDAGDKDLPIVLRALAESFGLNYQIDAGVHGTIQTKLQDVTLTQALDAIVLPQGYAYTLEDGVLRVGVAKLQTKIFPLDYVALSRNSTTNTTIQRRISSGGAGGGTGGGGTDQISSVSITDLWDELKVALVGLVFEATGATSDTLSNGAPAIPQANGLSNQNAALGSGNVNGGSGARSFSRVDRDGRRLIINPIAGTIVVTAPPAKLAEVATFMQTFEASVQRQVLIEAKIVEVKLNESYQFGIDWSRLAQNDKIGLGLRTSNLPGTPTVQFTLGGGASKVNVVLRALQTQGTVSVLSSPRVSTMNNMSATMGVTTDEVFFTVTSTPITNANGVVGTSQQVSPQTISVGIVLDVLPQISADNTITMNVRPHVTAVVDTATFITDTGSRITAPVVENRETDTMVRARAGETIVIGGLMQNAIVHTQSGVPGLQNLPIVGGLFRGRSTSNTKSELVIFITPTIVTGQPAIGN